MHTFRALQVFMLAAAAQYVYQLLDQPPVYIDIYTGKIIPVKTVDDNSFVVSDKLNSTMNAQMERTKTAATAGVNPGVANAHGGGLAQAAQSSIAAANAQQSL